MQRAILIAVGALLVFGGMNWLSIGSITIGTAMLWFAASKAEANKA